MKIDEDKISLFFSIEYLVDDIQNILQNSIDAIATRIIIEESDCVNDVKTCDDLTYDLSISILKCKFHQPVDTCWLALYHRIRIIS